MPSEHIELRNGRQVNLSIASFAALSPAVYPDGKIEVTLAVGAESEYEYELHPGDTFPVRDQTWKLDHIDDPGTREWVMHLVRIK
jgi:hypothetical protein